MEDWSRMTRRQRFGYWLVRLLGKFQQIIYHRVIGELVWRTAAGECMLPSQMTDQHLSNTIRMLNRRGDQPSVLQVLRNEQLKRWRLQVKSSRTSSQGGEHENPPTPLLTLVPSEPDKQDVDYPDFGDDG